MEDVIFEGANNGIFYSTVVKIYHANTHVINTILSEIIIILLLFGGEERGKRM